MLSPLCGMYVHQSMIYNNVCVYVYVYIYIYIYIYIYLYIFIYIYIYIYVCPFSILLFEGESAPTGSICHGSMGFCFV